MRQNLTFDLVINLNNSTVKKLILLLFLCVSVNAQKISSIDSLSYLQLEDISFTKEYKNQVVVKNYQISDGTWIKNGDIFVIGKPSNMNKLEAGSGYIAGSSVNSHSYIMLGTGAAAMTGTLMMGNENMTDDKAFIAEIKIARVSKKNPFEPVLEVNKVGGGRFLSIKKLARIYLEKALLSGEIINPNSPMTRETAIAKLKEAKDLLELEMMTVEEYDILKNELAPIIKNNK